VHGKKSSEKGYEQRCEHGFGRYTEAETVRNVPLRWFRQNSDVRLGEGETFYAPWEHDGKLFILKKGRMRLYRTEGAREFTLDVVEVGTVFGEMAFTPYRLRGSYARATEPSVVFVMERAAVERLIEEKPQVGIRMISLLSERLHYYETRLEDVTLKEMPARLASPLPSRRSLSPLNLKEPYDFFPLPAACFPRPQLYVEQ
jgi:CRP-like cAMP-binding protein